MNADTDEMKAVELNELDPEEQPMTEDHQETEEEKNGSTKLKAPGAKFTGLSKEELIKVAGTPCWVRTRCVLLILFWLGWVGMLAGAIVALVQAPLCKSIPDMSWWNEGPLYQISDVEAFSGGIYGGLLEQPDTKLLAGLTVKHVTYSEILQYMAFESCLSLLLLSFWFELKSRQPRHFSDIVLDHKRKCKIIC